MPEDPPYRGGVVTETGTWLSQPELGGRRLEIPGARVLYRPEDAASTAYFLESGQVRVFQVGQGTLERLADILGPGAWFGIGALAGTPTYNARAEVLGRAVVWAVESERLLGRLGERPEVAASLVRQLAARLRAAHEAAARLMFEDCNQRLVRTLLEFSQTSAASPHEGGVVLNITHQQLAQAVGAARETVSLALTQLRQRSLVRTGRNRLMFDPQVLRDFAEHLCAGGMPSARAAGEAPLAQGAGKRENGAGH